MQFPIVRSNNKTVSAVVAAVLALALMSCGSTRTSSSGPEYAPEIDAGSFVGVVDNPRFPLPVGAFWTYEVTTAEGSIDRLEVNVLAQTHSVMDIDTTVVRVELFVDDEIEERTDSWYAQDADGTVWLFGEIDEGYEAGELVETTTWEAGVGGAQPGTVIPAEPLVDQTFRVGYLPGEMEERGHLGSVAQSVEVSAGYFNGVWVIENWSDLEPDVVERKHYAPGIGLVLQDGHHADADVVELMATSLLAS